MSLIAPHRPICYACRLQQQSRHASLLRRPKRPYSFTQLITLSDGSTFTHRTTSPQPIYKSTRDTKNSVLWNPSSQKLLNVEEDEAGRLRRFRRRFGRGWDAEAMAEGGEEAAARDGEDKAEQARQEESLLDLIAGYGQEGQAVAGKAEVAVKSGKGKGGQK